MDNDPAIGGQSPETFGGPTRGSFPPGNPLPLGEEQRISLSESSFNGSGRGPVSGRQSTTVTDTANTLSPLPDFARWRGKTSRERLIREYRRKEHLGSLVRGEIAPILVLSGASGAGKSYVIHLLREHGVQQAERLITRSRRPSDPDSDVSWVPGSLRHDPDNLLFSYVKYGSHYAFPKDSLIKNVRRGESVALIAGDVGKLLPLNDALDYHVPFAPVVNIRIEVPLDVAESRLRKLRAEGEDGEAELRARGNQRLRDWEIAQLGVLTESLRIQTWLNFTREEYAQLKLSDKQIRPLDEEFVGQLYADSVTTEKERSAYSASLCLQPIATISKCDEFPAGLFEVLSEQLVPAMERASAIPLLKGGLASQIYLAASYQNVAEPPALSGAYAFERVFAPRQKPNRPVSPDIDWTFLETDAEEHLHAEVVEAITGKRESFVTDSDKAVFRSRKLRGSTESKDGHEVELDAIAVSRVQPAGSFFSYEFRIDDYLEFQRRHVRLEGGEHSISLVPPEMLVLEKLCAGRGEELGKLDIYDAVSLMLSQPINPRTLNHIILSQRFDGELDPKLNPELLEPPKLCEIDATLRDVGIQDNQLRQTVVERMLPHYERGDMGIDTSQEPLSVLPFHWTGDSLKQTALLDRLLRVLEKTRETERAAHEKGESTPLQECFSSEVVLEGIEAMQAYLRHLSQYYLGRQDLFLERTFKPEWIG